MERLRGLSWTALAAGIGVSVAISLVMLTAKRVAFPEGDGPWPQWYSVTTTLASALQDVAPGFVAGWIAARRGLLHGLLVALGVTLAGFIFAQLTFGSVPLQVLLVSVTFGAVASAITQVVAAFAGVAVRLKARVL
jgi:hypothetical protein